MEQRFIVLLELRKQKRGMVKCVKVLLQLQIKPHLHNYFLKKYLICEKQHDLLKVDQMIFLVYTVHKLPSHDKCTPEQTQVSHFTARDFKLIKQWWRNLLVLVFSERSLFHFHFVPLLCTERDGHCYRTFFYSFILLTLGVLLATILLISTCTVRSSLSASVCGHGCRKVKGKGGIISPKGNEETYAK